MRSHASRGPGACAWLVLAALIPLPAMAQLEASDVEPPNQRIHVIEQGGVRVSSAVPSASETDDIFGFRLYRRNVQPVWLRIENLSDERLLLMPSGIDQAYFTPLETAFRLRRNIPLLDWVVSEDLYTRNIRIMIEPGGVRTGYVFTRLDQGTKSFNVDVMGQNRQFRATFHVPVPGLRLDHYEVEFETLYTEDLVQDVDLDELVAVLEALPCCVTNNSGKTDGDPLNLVLIGEVNDLYYAFMRAGWDETETIYTKSLWQTLTSWLGGSEYRYSPVSALYVYGRPQDVALQKARSTINERNHLRLWLAPMRYQGKPVWIGQISRDIGVRFTWKTVTTHKIDPDVDETREYLVEDLAYAQSLAGLGYVGGVGVAPPVSPRGNLTGDPYFTDGLRAVLFVSSEPVDISEIEFIDLGEWTEAFPEAPTPYRGESN
jgi:hypothetical protein